MKIDARLHALRLQMSKAGLDAYIVPSSDPHQSEYVADRWKSRQWISGFSGSAGYAIITQDHAGIWTDGRYFLQAEKELSDTAYELHKSPNNIISDILSWLASEMPENTVVGVDGWMISQALFETFEQKLRSHNLKINTKYDLIADIWDDRPELPTFPIFEHDAAFAGASRIDRIASVREKMLSQGAEFYLASALDDIAWLLNLRGCDVECNPVFIAYLLMSQNEVKLYIDHNKINRELSSKLAEQGITILPYFDILKDLNHLSEESKILVDKSQLNVSLYQGINSIKINGKSIAKWEKAVKNDIEIKHLKNAMAKDGAALAESFFWLENELQNRGVSEYELAQQLIKNRSAKDHYYGESFHAIIGYKGNGAIIHYRPLENECAIIQKTGLLLVDSGGQYHDGTTDITRTFSLGNTTDEQRKNYTLVLKGMIALTQAKFPVGTPGGQLDSFARQYLWHNKLNYIHGTGHGVGFFMNVHEPPQGFAAINSERGKTPFQAGMITSNEPGYYKENEYGIRIENLLVSTDTGDNFLAFDTLTLYPLEHKLMDKSLLSASDIDWINHYHQLVFNRIEPLLKDDKIKTWFKNKCAMI